MSRSRAAIAARTATSLRKAQWQVAQGPVPWRGGLCLVLVPVVMIRRVCRLSQHTVTRT